jgi:hypothetical protein
MRMSVYVSGAMLALRYIIMIVFIGTTYDRNKRIRSDKKHPAIDNVYVSINFVLLPCFSSFFSQIHLLRDRINCLLAYAQCVI